jgi:hypothetical protein
MLSAGDATGCQAFSPQGTSGNRAGRENFVLLIEPLHGSDTSHAMCRAATAALAKVLDTAGLH